MKFPFLHKCQWALPPILVMLYSCNNVQNDPNEIHAKSWNEKFSNAPAAQSLDNLESLQKINGSNVIAFLNNEEKALVWRETDANVIKLVAINTRLKSESSIIWNRGKSINYSRPRHAYRLVITDQDLCEEIRLDKNLDYIGIAKMTLTEKLVIKKYFLNVNKFSNSDSPILFQSVAIIDSKNGDSLKRIIRTLCNAEIVHFVDGRAVCRVFVETPQYLDAICLLHEVNPRANQ